MLLADLYALYQRLVEEGRVMPLGFRQSKVHLLVDLTIDGQVAGVAQLYDDRGRGTDRVVPNSTRTSGAYAHLVCDGLDYVAALPESPAKIDQAAHRHRLYLERLADCRNSLVGRPAALIGAVMTATQDARRFRSELVRHGVPLDFNVFEAGIEPPPDSGRTTAGSKWLTDFRVDDRPLFPEIDGDPGEADVVGWWSALQADESSADVELTCQVSGRRSRVAKLFPATKLPGNQPRLVSANFDAALRYGAQQSQGAAVSGEAAAGATQALNWLVDEQKDRHRWSFEDLNLVWWAPEDPDLDPLKPLLDPNEVRDLVPRSVWSGREQLAPTSPFLLALLTVNSARVVVLGDHRTTLGGIEAQISEWFEVIRPAVDPDNLWRTGIPELARGACGPGRHQGKARGRAATALLRSALFGERLPQQLRSQVVARCAVGESDRRGGRRHVTNAQAAVLHLVAASWKENPMPRSPAELCGRILSALEETQDAALGDINRGVVATYASASATPQLAFPRLLARRQAHMRRLRRDKPGAAVHVDRKLGELMSELQEAGGFPARLTPEGQSQFALGYFHERQARFTRRTPDSPNPDPEDQP